MALSSFVVRRSAASLISFAARSAASSSLAHPSHGSSSFSFLHLFTPRRLPFSTSTCPPDSYHNIGDKIESEIACYSNEVAGVPSWCPFKIRPTLDSKTICLERRYQHERITVETFNEIANPGNGDAPFLPTSVVVHKGKFTLISCIEARPDQLHIRKVVLSNHASKMKHYKKYLRSRGITPKAISFIYHCLGLD